MNSKEEPEEFCWDSADNSNNNAVKKKESNVKLSEMKQNETKNGRSKTDTNKCNIIANPMSEHTDKSRDKFLNPSKSSPNLNTKIIVSKAAKGETVQESRSNQVLKTKEKNGNTIEPTSSNNDRASSPNGRRLGTAKLPKLFIPPHEKVKSDSKNDIDSNVIINTKDSVTNAVSLSGNEKITTTERKISPPKKFVTTPVTEFGSSPFLNKFDRPKINKDDESVPIKKIQAFRTYSDSATQKPPKHRNECGGKEDVVRTSNKRKNFSTNTNPYPSIEADSTSQARRFSEMNSTIGWYNRYSSVVFWS